MGEITIWHLVVVAAVIGLYFLFRSPKRNADGSAVSSVSRNARKSLLFGDTTLPSSEAAARKEVQALIEEAKSQMQEYEWQYIDSGKQNNEKNQLKLVHDTISRILQSKLDNIDMNDNQLKTYRRKLAITNIINNHSIEQINILNNKGYKYLTKHPATNFFESFHHNDAEFAALKQEALILLSEKLLAMAEDIIGKARKAIPSDPNIALVEQGLSELDQGKDFSAFSQQTALSNLKSGLQSAELKALSTNRATVLVTSKLSMHNKETKFRNAQEAFQNVQKGLYIPAGSQITCHVTDVYGSNTLVFSASTDSHNDISKPLFHTDWRP